MENPDVVPETALVDTACAKSVAGRPWAKDVVARLLLQGYIVQTVTEREPFRFGPGRRIWSEEALLIPFSWFGYTFILRVSV